MSVFDLKTLLSDDERKEYDAALKRIEELEQEKWALQGIIDDLRNRIGQKNHEMNSRLLASLKNK